MHFRVARFPLVLAIGLLPGMLSPAMADDSRDDRERPGVWALKDLYATPEAWQQAFKQVSKQIDGLDRYQGHLTDNPEALAKALSAISDVMKEVGRLNTYASLKADEDLRDSTARERSDQASRLMAHYREMTGYVRPELSGMDASTLSQWARLPVLDTHRYFLENILREAPHTLSRSTESALAALSPVTTTNTSYSLLTNADIEWPDIDIEGQSYSLDQAGYAQWRESPDRDVRQRVFNTFWPAWQQYEATLGSLLGNQVLEHVINARLHHYDSALEAALSDNDIPVGVYHQLITSTNEHLPTLHRYLKLRQRMLGIDQLHYYDIYPPLVKSDRQFSIDDARQLTLEATRPLGDHYADLIRQATGEAWTSVYPTQGKRSGAYMNGSAYDVHPYVLLNFNGTYNDVSTYAHEWGHGIHSMLTNESQPYETSDYPIFTAEVAAITNEELLIDQMIKQARTDSEKLFYIGQALESLRGTFFRQSQFAEFELAIHEASARGESLSGQRLTRLYGDILKKYYGVDQGITDINPDYFIEWAYVPHFYYDFYVYQYATSITAAHYFASKLEQDPDKNRDTYLKVLKSGGSDSGYRLLKNAGIDLATPQPYEALMAYMNDLLDQAERILEKT